MEKAFGIADMYFSRLVTSTSTSSVIRCFRRGYDCLKFQMIYSTQPAWASLFLRGQQAFES